MPELFMGTAARCMDEGADQDSRVGLAEEKETLHGCSLSAR